MSERLNSLQPYVLGLFRIVTGLLFACHGAASLFGVLGGAHGGGTVPAGAWPGWYAAVIQLVAGVLVLLGVGTRSASFLASGSMAYAYFVVHQPEALWPLQNHGESSAMFCWAFLLLVFTGPGAFALERVFTAGDGSARGDDSPRVEEAAQEDRRQAVAA
ncbi:DoxX family protein [Streptomyces bambusae]|uniref:DoxX family membrane protein n=1 Tax=Streptomyces bambusae TaxID=1550616 RepID=A0ABS6ZDQ2_9ACTN|nr:DoxX family protein [Streptomyces bambusae]MBW5485892.1 DoxX family membrane protein [Streptomyces bambusae]